MAFCAKCGVQISEGVAFCPSCGAPVSGAPGSAGGATPGSSPAVGSAMSSNVAGLLCYVLGFITGIIFLVLEPYKNDRFVRFHAFQSIFFSVAWLVIYWVLGMLLVPVAWGVGFSFFWLLWGLIRLALFAIWIFLMYKAYNNQKYELPIIGPLAAKQAG
jgi:uncharacterized membrane protein